MNTDILTGTPRPNEHRSAVGAPSGPVMTRTGGEGVLNNRG